MKLTDTFTDLTANLKKEAQQLLNTAKEVVRDATNARDLANVVTSTKKIAALAETGIKRLVEFKDATPGVIDELNNAKNAVTTAYADLKGIVNGLKKGELPKVNTDELADAIEQFQEKVNKITKAIPLGEQISSAVSQGLDKVKDMLCSILDTIVNILKEVSKTIEVLPPHQYTTVAKQVVSTVKEMAEGMQKGMSR